MAWRLADSLVTLRNQVDNAYPNRNRASDGTIGDQSHASGASDHNPNGAGVVTALDLTNNPPYFNAHALADNLIVNRHPNLKYVISNSRIAGAFNGWRWQPYDGSNPHDKHIHVSVGVGSDGQSSQPYDDKTPWSIIKGGDDDMPLPEDGDITNFKRLETGVPTYQPTGAEFRHYKAPENGWKKLAYDARKGAEYQIGVLKKQVKDAENAKPSDYKPYDGAPLFLKKG